MNVPEGYIAEGIALGTIKRCPFCGSPGELASGCNYIKCPAAVGENNSKKKCNGEWCWVCHKPKYRAIPNKTELGFCNDSKHNSH